LSRDGFVKRPLMGDRLGGMDSDIGRALFQWTATEDLTVTFSIDGTRSRGDSAAEELTKFDPTASLATLWNTFIGIPQGTPISPSYVDAPKYVNMGTGLNENTLDLWGTSVTVDWDLGEIAFKSITAYREFKAHYGHDTDGTPLVYQATEYRDTQHQFSQEFQISGDSFDNRLKWVAGVFYMDEHATGDAILNVASGLYNATAGLVPPPMQVALDLDLHSLMDQKTESYAAFGQATLVLTDQFSITAGARYSKDKKDFLVDMLRMNSGAKLADNVEIDDSWSSFTPRVGIEFKANEDTLLYASASRGFKSGGFNGRPTQGPGDVKSFAPEYVWSYEAGIKADWLDRRVRTNLAVFHTDYKGIQLTSTATDPVTNILSIFVENGGKARVRGAEAELTARVTPNLDFNAAVGYTDAKYTHIEPGVQSITLASKLVKAPKWTANAGLQYGISLGDNGLILVRGDWNYKSAHFNDVANSQTTWQKGYSLFNARISYTSANELWEFAIFGTNLTDKYYYEGGVESASLGMGVAVIGRPREYGVSLKRNF
jgi:iron complex outermembrane receptor protein